MSAPTSPASPDRDLVDEFAKHVLAVVAPEELAIFEETADEYHQDPQGVLSATGRDETVGFGLDLALLTPYVLAVVAPVLRYLLDTVGEAAKQESKPLIAELVHRLFRRGKNDEKAAPAKQEETLTADQAARVREIALARAQDLKLPESKARLLADAIVGGLNLAP